MLVSTFLDNITAEEEQQPDRKEKSILISGYVNTAPSDLIEFVEVTDIREVLAEHSVTACLMFKPELCDIIRMVVDYPQVFDFRLVVLAGIPDCNYSPEFESACYNRARVSFHSVVSDLRDSLEKEKGLASESEGIYGKEQARIRRSDGSIKQLGEIGRGENPDDVPVEDEN